MGVITRGWTYLNRGLTVPDAEIEVDLLAPGLYVNGFLGAIGISLSPLFKQVNSCYVDPDPLGLNRACPNTL